MAEHDEDAQSRAVPIDEADPRFGVAPRRPPPARRRLERSQGPDASRLDPRVRILRVAVPALFVAGVLATGLVFFAGLRPGPTTQALGPSDAVHATVSARPRRVCLHDRQPCAWLTVVNGELLALQTSGPLLQEYGRLGVEWCPSSGYFGSDTSGSRFDAAGRVVRGPAPRGLDRFGVHVEPDGTVVVDFAVLRTGLQSHQTTTTVPPTGPDCAEIPYDRTADLALD